MSRVGAASGLVSTDQMSVTPGSSCAASRNQRVVVEPLDLVVEPAGAAGLEERALARGEVQDGDLPLVPTTRVDVDLEGDAGAVR